MKNLKRVLTLVLAVAMMFSIAAVASANTIVGGYNETAGSKAYADYDSIANKEAVDVLTELTVLDGFEDGNYHPEKNLTRAQMAKIIAYISAAPQLSTSTTMKKFLDSFAATCTFNDVAGHWAIGSIGYDQYSGIVDGVDGKNFNPDRSVKKIEAAKMALVVLGYDANQEGLVGADWVGNTMALALAKGLFDGIDTTDVNAFITRDEMAQLVYNMLLATMVGYIEVDDALIKIDQVNGLARIYGNNFNFWRNSDLFAGKQAIQYYFGKNVAFTTGIVVANGYTNLGLTEDQMGFQGSYDVSFGGLTATYDPAFETVIYIPGGTCIGTGYCIGAHNIHNANCPANTQAAQLLVVPIYSCYDEIGREVKLTNVGNIIDVETTAVIDQFTSMVVTANNQAEVVTATGAVNANATIKQAPGTILTGIFACKDDQGYGAPAVDHVSFEVPGIVDVSATFTAAYVCTPADLASATASVYNYPGLVHYNIDYNGDNIADFSIAVEELLASPTQPNADLKSAALKAIVDTDGVILHGEAPTAGTVSLYHFGIAYNELNDQGTPKCVINDNLVANTGFVDSWTGNYIANDWVFNTVEFDGTEYTISQLCTRELLPKNTKFEIGNDMLFWLDHGGNVVRLAEIAAPASIEALVYGITRSTHTYSDTEYQVYTIYTITKDGEKAEYDLIPEPDMDDELAAEIFDNTVANYCLLSFDRDYNVVALEDLSNIKDTSYTKGTLILGDIAQEYADIVSVLEANDVLFVGIDDVDAYVTDETVFFNFQKGKGAFEYYDWTDSLMNARNNWAMQQKKIKVGEVNISKVDAIADTTLGSTFLKHVDAREGVVTLPDYADYVILSFVNKYVPIKEIDTYPVDQTGATTDEFVYISLDDLSFVSQVKVEAVDANGSLDFLWKVPCSPATYKNANFPKAEAGYVYILDSQLDVVTDAVMADGDGALFHAFNIPGYYNDELEVVDLSDDEIFVNGTIMSNSNLIERLAIADDEQAWNTAAPEASKIYKIENGTMTQITRADLKIGDKIAYIRSDLEGTAPIGVARGFADTIQIAFVGDLPTAPAE